MSMIARVRVLLLVVLLPALLGSATLHALAVRDALQAQLQQRNQDAAAMLALALSQQQGDTTLLPLVAAALFDTGHYRDVVLRAPDGRLLVDLHATAPRPAAPHWFLAALPLDAAPGVAQVSDGWQPLGRLEVATHPAWAHDALWSAGLRSLGWLLVLGVASALAAGAALRAWRRPLRDTVSQAQSLEEGRYVLAAEPAIPELRQLTRSMNSLVKRLHEQFDRQTVEAERLRREATLDPVTGMLLRRHLLARVEAALQASPGAGAALLIVRVRGLAALNGRLGRAGADRLLAALAEVLQAYPQRVDGAVAGRLNGSDFALFLPRSGVALDSARALLAALRPALLRIDPGAELAIGGVEGRLPALPLQETLSQEPLSQESLSQEPLSQVLAWADQALARAEAAGPFGIEVTALRGSGTPPNGEHQWQRQLAAALSAGRVQLAAFAVRDRDGGLLALECPLRVQLHAGGVFEPAARWLPMAARHRLLPQVDLAALDLALQAIGNDGVARSVHVAVASLQVAGFVAELRARLEEAPQAAQLLWIEVPEDAAVADAALLVDVVAQWRGGGAHVGLGHAGDALQALAPLPVLGLDFVKVDGVHLRGLAADAQLQAFARSLLALMHPLGLRVLAGGIDDAADLAMLWDLGFDGATGPAVP
jgi:EAL domain-containing protein (putative c-di-GMP-specific phosphodiesterase class I)/GGDEF domain-containing protein